MKPVKMHLKRYLIFVSVLIALLASVKGNANESDSRSTQSEFRIDTAVYVGDEQQPSSQNTTLFTKGMVYDFSTTVSDREPSEITIYDSKNDAFVLLDPKRKIKFVIQMSQLLTLVSGLLAETNQNPDSRFLTSDEYREEHDISSGWYILKNDIITYSFRGKPPANTQLVQAYDEFLNKYTLLGATDPRRLPPFPRLHLNRSVQKLGLIPTEIRLSVRETELLRRPLMMTSKHTLIEGLSDSDRLQIESANRNWSGFEPVNMATYRGLSVSEDSPNWQK